MGPPVQGRRGSRTSRPQYREDQGGRHKYLGTIVGEPHGHDSLDVFVRWVCSCAPRDRRPPTSRGVTAGGEEEETGSFRVLLGSAPKRTLNDPVSLDRFFERVAATTPGEQRIVNPG